MRTVAYGHDVAPTARCTGCTESHQPDHAVAVAHRVMGPAPVQLMVISFKGRKTGRQYAIPVSAYQIDNSLDALIAEAWQHNFRDGATAEVLHDGKTTTMRGELIQDRAAVVDLYRRRCETYGIKIAQRMMGMKFRDQQMPSLEDVSEVVEREHLAHPP